MISVPSIEPFVPVISMIIGICCSVNLFYFLSLYHVPLIISVSASLCGGMLNFILYNKNLVPELKKLYDRASQLREKGIKYVVIEVLALFSGLVLGLHNYNSWVSLMGVSFFSAMPGFFPMLSSICFAIGSYTLMYDSIKDSLEQLFEFNVDEFSTYVRSNWLGVILGAASGLLLTVTGYYPIVVRSFALGDKFSLASISFHAMYACSIMYSELVFNVQQVVQAIEHVWPNLTNGQFTQEYGWWLPGAVMLNAGANGFLTVGESTYTWPWTLAVVVIGSVASCAVMMNSLFYGATTDGRIEKLEKNRVAEALESKYLKPLVDRIPAIQQAVINSIPQTLRPAAQPNAGR